MAPGYNDLAQDDGTYDSEEELDFSDLREQHEVRLEQGLDAFVVVDGLPVVPEASKPKLVTFLIKKLNSAGKVKEDGFFMPVNEKGMTEGYAFVEYQTPQQASQACKHIHGTPIDKKHTFGVNKITDIDRYGKEGKIDDEYHAPRIDDFSEKEHLRWWLGDSNSRDQVVMYQGDSVSVCWNKKKDQPENIVDRMHWTEKFVGWSPLGTYLATMHAKGVQLWGGASWSRQTRFPHPECNLIDFSPNEQYLCTWSFKPIEVAEDDPIMSQDEDGKNYIIWDLTTGRPLRSFTMHDLPTVPDGPDGVPAVKKQIPWPAFKWSADDKYVARMLEGQSISIYELPKMNLLDKTTVKIEGVLDFEWAPATPQRDGVKAYEQLFCFWTPEIGSNPAKVGLMSIPSKEIVRTRNLFNVTDAKLHWQSQAAYVCVKVDRHSKSKKSLATNLEIFRVREKGVPVEVVDSIKDTVINFAWEPKGDRFVLITTAEVMVAAAVPPKTAVSFFCPEKSKSNTPGNFKHIRTIEKKNNNSIHWSPKGRFVVVATILSQQSFDLDFWDLDFEGEKPESDKDLTANLQLMNTADHYGVTDVDWDPTGRYVFTSASSWKHTMENGYHLYLFDGTLLREEHLDKFKQLLWRPRPPTLLTRDDQKAIRKNLREYSKDFEEQDRIEEDKERGAVVEERRRVLSEWLAWREGVLDTLREERAEAGLDPDKLAEDVPEEVAPEGEEGGSKVVEEIVEEVLDETEEIM